jgi:hypothetical protein
MDLQWVAPIQWIATSPLTFMAYKYSELQMSITSQKLSCKASYKTSLFLIVNWSEKNFPFCSQEHGWCHKEGE